MLYQLTEGKYAEFRGYVFANGKAVDVTDKGTLEIIGRYPQFKPVPNKAPVAPAPVIDPDSCPKCGKVVRQGKYMHQKHCKG